MLIGITGSTGFIGKNLIQEFIELNNKYKQENKDKEFPYKLILLLRENSNVKNIKNFILNCSEIETRTVDFFNKEDIKKNIKDVDFIIHLAGVTKAKRKIDYYKYNFCLTKNIVDAIFEINLNNINNKNINIDKNNNDYKIIKFIFFSSQSSCGPSKKGSLISEKDIENPISNYGKSKLKAELYIKEKIKDFIILRFPSILGPYDMDGLNLFKMVLKKLIFGIGKNFQFDVIYSKEVTQIIKFFIINFKNFNNKVIHIGYKNPLDFKYFINKVRDLANKKGNYIYINVPIFFVIIFAIIVYFINLFQKNQSIINFEKIIEISKKNWIYNKDLFLNSGYTFQYDIDSMIEETFFWYKSKHLL
ncbi:MAG: NAD(P)-dependent oxidoreductase [Spirochaetes bacterium]|nr:NAD(P)-dependent oxidoreductase [Spirochaetota bacterium]